MAAARLVVDRRAARGRRDPRLCGARPRAAEWSRTRDVDRDLPGARHHRRYRTGGRASAAVAHAVAHRLDQHHARPDRRRQRRARRICRLELYCLPRRKRGEPSRPLPHPGGMDGAAIYKQLDDFRAGKRSWGAMNAIALALSAQDSADVGAYFASRTNGLPPAVGERFQSGHTLREDNPAIRLAFAGDPARGIPPCAACHGPGDHKLGAPQLKTQQPAYIERQLAAFAQGFRPNDINEQMRTIAMQLTPQEMHVIAEFYGTGAATAQVAGR